MNEPSSRRQHHMGWVTVSMATAGGVWRHRPPEEHVWLFIYLPFICHQFETKSILFVCRFRLMTLFRWYLMQWQEYLRCLLTMFLPRADALLIKLSILFSFSMQVFYMCCILTPWLCCTDVNYCFIIVTFHTDWQQGATARAGWFLQCKLSVWYNKGIAVHPKPKLYLMYSNTVYLLNNTITL